MYADLTVGFNFVSLLTQFTATSDLVVTPHSLPNAVFSKTNNTRKYKRGCSTSYQRPTIVTALAHSRSLVLQLTRASPRWRSTRTVSDDTIMRVACYVGVIRHKRWGRLWKLAVVHLSLSLTVTHTSPERRRMAFHGSTGYSHI